MQLPMITYLLICKILTYVNGLSQVQHIAGVLPSDSLVKPLESLIVQYEDDKNSLIAVTETDNEDLYDYFYDELDNRMILKKSMNMIFFGPSSSFLRLDAETVLHILINTKKHYMPIARTLLAWDVITDGKTSAFLQNREYLAFGSLLNNVPEEDLYYVNFADPSVLKYFAYSQVDLKTRKIGILLSAYRRYYGNDWFRNSSSISELGYLLCGFPAEDLKMIPPHVFKDINVDVMSKLTKCSVKQIKTLYDIATHPEAYGEPYQWTSHEISRLNMLFISIPSYIISGLQLESITAIKQEVMRAMDQRKLSYFTKEQILRMNPKTRRIYILRSQLKNSLDMDQISKSNSCSMKTSISYLVVYVGTLLVK